MKALTVKIYALKFEKFRNIKSGVAGERYGALQDDRKIG